MKIGIKGKKSLFVTGDKKLPTVLNILADVVI